MAIEFFNTPLEGLLVAEHQRIEDERGYFTRIFCMEEFERIGLNKTLNQINHTQTNSKGTVRGLHYQLPPYTETKVVRCLKGEIFDVVVDIRKGSSTFLHCHGEILSESNQRSLFIPEGFAHGYQTLCDDCELIYLHTSPFVKASEAALNIADPLLDIHWPITISKLSDRDRSHLFLSSGFEGISI